MTGQAPAFDTKFIGVAEGAFDAPVGSGGSITPNAAEVKFSLEGLPDTACNAHNNGSKYTCTFPAGSTVTVKPTAEGVTFRPPSYTYNFREQTELTDPYARNFSAQ